MNNEVTTNNLAEDLIIKHRELQKILNQIKEYPEFYPDILNFIASEMTKYKEKCKKENDWLLREALGDACCLLGSKRKPPASVITKFSIRIKKAIFKDGLNQYHHQGERNFFERYLKE